MTYCSTCGKRNEDEALFCSSCGTPLQDQTSWKRYRKVPEDKCEEECSQGTNGSPMTWGIILVLVGLFIVIPLLLSILGIGIGWFFGANFFQGETCTYILVLIGVLVVIGGISTAMKRSPRRSR